MAVTEHPIQLEPSHNFKRRQRVSHCRLMGATFEPNWDERCTIIGKPFSVSDTSGFWWPVKFDDGGELCIPETALRAL